MILRNDCPAAVEGNLGQDIVIRCKHEPIFTASYCFDGTDDNKPLIRLEDSVISGRGYTSVEFDLTSNGSLVIKCANFANLMNCKAPNLSTLHFKTILYKQKFRLLVYLSISVSLLC